MHKTDTTKIVIGTRASKLARAQTDDIAGRLRGLGASPVIQTIRTSGDIKKGPLEGGIGFFVKEIEAALLAGEVDMAVHSMKDLPTAPRQGLVVAAVPERVDVRDALVSRGDLPLDKLPPESRIGTSSARRAAQLCAHRPDLLFVPVRGNVDTRLRKLAEGDFEALVIACAGLLRLGLQDCITEALPIDICLPAPGQGALALQCRQDDARVLDLLRALDHPPSRQATTAERAFLARLGVGCSLPIGAFAEIEGGKLLLRGVVAHPEGAEILRHQLEGDTGEAAALGNRLAEKMLQAGAGRLLETING